MVLKNIWNDFYRSGIESWMLFARLKIIQLLFIL